MLATLIARYAEICEARRKHFFSKKIRCGLTVFLHALLDNGYSLTTHLQLRLQVTITPEVSAKVNALFACTQFPNTHSYHVVICPYVQDVLVTQNLNSVQRVVRALKR